MAMRKGMGKGTGKGYKNIIPKDKSVHSLSAKGIKQPQSRTRKRAVMKPKMPKKVSFPKPSTVAIAKMSIIAGKYNLSVTQTSQFIDFFRKRFPHHIQGDYVEEQYADTWAKRMANDSIFDYADIQSTKVLKEIGYKKVEQPKQIIKLERVEYGTSNTPLHLREYRLNAQSPVGNLKELEEYFDGENVKIDVNLTMAQKKEVTKRLKLIDSDNDGVGDILDCQPQNPNMQDDDFEDIGKFTERVTKKESLGKRALNLGKQGFSYVSDLNKARIQKNEAFRQELANLNEKQLRELAIRYQDTSIFGSSNPYESEIIRREREKHYINKKLNEERKRAKEDAEKGSGLF